MPRKNKGASPEEHARAKIARYLPDAIDHAIQSYRDFYTESAGRTSKEFSAHHTACKAAIAHIELLLKLAAWAHLPREDDDGNLAALLADAQDELDRYREERDA